MSQESARKVKRVVLIEQEDWGILKVSLHDPPDCEEEDVRYADKLTYDECLGLVATLTRAEGTYPGLQWLKTSVQWAAREDRLAAMRRSREQGDGGGS